MSRLAGRRLGGRTSTFVAPSDFTQIRLDLALLPTSQSSNTLTQTANVLVILLSSAFWSSSSICRAVGCRV